MRNICFSGNNIKAVNIRSRLPSYINRSNVQSFFDFYLEFHICPEVIKNKFAHGTDLKFYDKQKNVKTKIKNKIFSTMEELVKFLYQNQKADVDYAKYFASTLQQ